jgi:uncharacterized protein YcaQ
MKVTKEQIKNFIINRSYINEKGSSILEVLEYLTCIQVDPINAVARTHELSLFNRVKDFKISDLYKELYENRTIFEYWLQLYSFIPSKFFPYFRASMETKDTWHSEYYKQHKKEIDETLRYITENGETSSKELSHIKRTGDVFSWTGSSRTGVLDYLWDKGIIMVSKRKANRKYYNLSERVIDGRGRRSASSTHMESLKFLLESSFNYLGVVRSPYLYRAGRPRETLFREEFKRLLEKGEIIKLQIDGSEGKGRRSASPTYYILKRDAKTLENSKLEHTGLNILPPLDPIVIDRDLLNDVFGFFYRWEAYTPPAKRLFGYYGMPVLYKGEIVGQVELVKDAKKKVSIKNLKVSVRGKEFNKLLKEEVKKIEKLIATS